MRQIQNVGNSIKQLARLLLKVNIVRKDGKFFYLKKDEGDIRSNIMCEPSLNLDKKKKTAIKVYF